MDVQVPGRRREVANPLELGGEERELLPGQASERVPEELQRAPGPPHADPKVVQELSVDIRQDALGVGVDRVKQAQQDGRARTSGGHARGDVRVHLVRVVARAAADHPQRVGERRPGALGDAGDGGEQTSRAAGRARVSAHVGDREPGRQRVLAGTVKGRPVDDQLGDRLVVFVQQPVDIGRGAGGNHGHERAHADEARDADADRAPRQVGKQVRAGQPPAGYLLRRLQPGRAGGAQFAAAAAGDVLQGQASLVQPPVEGVEPGNSHGGYADRARDRTLGCHGEFRAKRRQYGGNDVIPVLRIATVGNKKCQGRGHRNSFPGSTHARANLSINSLLYGD